jgi:hypothetical protein
MSFEDLARHMSARDGVSLSSASDPRQMMIEAQRAKRRHQRTRDLILGPLLLLCGLAGIALTAANVLMVSENGGGFVFIYYGAILGAFAAGAGKLARGLRALFRERAPQIAIRTVRIDGDAYRNPGAPLAGPPPFRRVEPRPLAEVARALSTLMPVVRRKSVVVGHAWIGIRTPNEVEPSTMIVETHDVGDAIRIADALVPLFGPLAVHDGQLGWIVVDGKRSVAELCAEQAARYRDYAAQNAA